MRRLATLLALLCAGSAQAQVVGGDLDGILKSLARSPVVFRDSFVASGPLILDTPNTVAHVTWNGTQLVDSFGNTWTQNGTVPQVAGATVSPMFPSGFNSAPRSGAGPYSSSNYYSAAIATPMNFAAAPFSFCEVFIPKVAVAGASIGASLNGSATTGYGWITDGTGLGMNFYANSIATLAAAGSAVLNGLNIFCGGNDGTNTISKGNLMAMAVTNTATHPYTQSAATPVQLGYNSTEVAFSGTILEAWYSTDVPTDALFTAIQQRVLNEVADTGQIIADVRASTTTYRTNDVRWIAPANVPTVEMLSDGGGGLLVTAAATEYLLNNTAPATQTTASLGTGAYTGNSLGTGGVTFSVVGATATGLPCTTTTFLDVGEAGDCHFTVTVAGTVLATVVGSVTFEQLTNTAYRVPDIIAAGTATTVIADVISVTNPATLNGKPWCMGATVAPYAGTWAVTGSAISAGASHTGANSVELDINASLADIGLVYDATPTLKQQSFTLADSKAHKLLVCNAAGTITQWVDGALVSGAGSGAGTGILGANPSTIYLGSEAGGTPGGQAVYLQNVLICNSSAGGSCK
jgi:hypothetical protein